MWPVGTYKRFLQKIKGQEGSASKANFFGVLFCDVCQSKSKEYILNYLDVFQKYSGKYFDFYIPGYIPKEELREKELNLDNTICISNKVYIFKRDKYNEFCYQFERDFNVEYPFSATLVLMEYRNGNFSSARKMVFELEDTDKGIKSAGCFFREIFKCAEKENIEITIDALSKQLSFDEKVRMIPVGANAILSFLGVDLEPITNQCQKVLRFRVR